MELQAHYFYLNKMYSEVSLVNVVDIAHASMC